MPHKSAQETCRPFYHDNLYRSKSCEDGMDPNIERHENELNQKLVCVTDLLLNLGTARRLFAGPPYTELNLWVDSVWGHITSGIVWSQILLSGPDGLVYCITSYQFSSRAMELFGPAISERIAALVIVDTDQPNATPPDKR
ncbi:hypothetical protein RRG08_036799 [Elysia crispata]|uniref:Uncharacterized protein n=1 Tax=Elysia crispata TaxID=231223 RepID=A0AAE1DXK5_9GAST|nr:hypothetical protein RRG08_036799 [Elysia crispata]